MCTVLYNPHFVQATCTISRWVTPLCNLKNGTEFWCYGKSQDCPQIPSWRGASYSSNARLFTTTSTQCHTTYLWIRVWNRSSTWGLSFPQHTACECQYCYATISRWVDLTMAAFFDLNLPQLFDKRNRGNIRILVLEPTVAVVKGIKVCKDKQRTVEMDDLSPWFSQHTAREFQYRYVTLCTDGHQWLLSIQRVGLISQINIHCF